MSPEQRGARLSRGYLVTYALALLSSAVALGLSLLLAPIGGDDSIPGLLFLSAVGVSGWFGGFGPALLSTAFGALALDYFFETPPLDMAVARTATVAYLLSFVVMSVLLGSLNARLRQSNRSLRSERDRAEEAVRARDDLIATVSHGLRSPLTAIKTSIYSLRDSSVPLSDDKRARLLSNVAAEADRLAQLVAGALALRQLEIDQTPHWERLEPAEVVSAALDRCLPLLGRRQVTFNISADLPEVRMDAALLDQALTALLENAAMHTPADSPVLIEGGVHVGEFYVSVSDAGPGIPAEARQRIFEKYERLDRSRSGVGLGLAIARTAVETQGGRLCVDDSCLGGARFTIVIPTPELSRP